MLSFYKLLCVMDFLSLNDLKHIFDISFYLSAEMYADTNISAITNTSLADLLV